MFVFYLMQLLKCVYSGDTEIPSNCIEFNIICDQEIEDVRFYNEEEKNDKVIHEKLTEGMWGSLRMEKLSIDLKCYKILVMKKNDFNDTGLVFSFKDDISHHLNVSFDSETSKISLFEYKSENKKKSILQNVMSLFQKPWNLNFIFSWFRNGGDMVKKLELFSKTLFSDDTTSKAYILGESHENTIKLIKTVEYLKFSNLYKEIHIILNLFLYDFLIVAKSSKHKDLFETMVTPVVELLTQFELFKADLSVQFMDFVYEKGILNEQDQDKDQNSTSGKDYMPMTHQGCIISSHLKLLKIKINEFWPNNFNELLGDDNNDDDFLQLMICKKLLSDILKKFEGFFQEFKEREYLIVEQNVKLIKLIHKQPFNKIKQKKIRVKYENYLKLISLYSFLLAEKIKFKMLNQVKKYYLNELENYETSQEVFYDFQIAMKEYTAEIIKYMTPAVFLWDLSGIKYERDVERVINNEVFENLTLLEISNELIDVIVRVLNELFLFVSEDNENNVKMTMRDYLELKKSLYIGKKWFEFVQELINEHGNIKVLSLFNSMTIDRNDSN